MSVLDERFHLWVEGIELGPASGRSNAQRAAADALAAAQTPASAFELVAYAVGAGGADAAFAAVRRAVTESDPTFEAVAGDLEPRLVAAAALARLLESGGQAATLAAGALLSAEFAGLHSPVEELPSLARVTLAERFRTVRERVAVPRVRLDGILDPPPHFGDGGPSTEERLRALGEGTAMLAERFGDALESLAARVEARLDASDEELDVLWWAFSANSSDPLQEHWSGLGTSPEPLLRAALELANRHRGGAETPAAQEILRRVLGSLADQEFTIAEVVAAAGGTVALDEVTPSALLPILTSCGAFRQMRSATAEDGHLSEAQDSPWLAHASRHGITVTAPHRGDALAAQTTRELLLARTLAR
jgi:hypothetical protein